MDFNEYENIIDNVEVNSPERPNTEENFANEVEYDDVVGDSDDSMGSERAYPLDKNKLKKSSNIFYKGNALKMGKVRKYKYALKNIGSLYIATWTREEGEKDNNLSISSSNFKREYSKRKIKHALELWCLPSMLLGNFMDIIQKGIYKGTSGDPSKNEATADDKSNKFKWIIIPSIATQWLNFLTYVVLLVVYLMGGDQGHL